jgi:phenylalanyl-tRNA synthetase alpha subunit
MDIKIDRSDEMRLREELAARTDAEAARINRYLGMADLSRTPGSPLYEITERVKQVSGLANFDIIEIPEIVPADISFDLFDFPADHPARSTSDTYYVDDKNILRTHDTVFWYYYLQHPEIKARIERGESMGALCYGKVYRKDEIDSRHMNIFHQLGGWYIAPESEKVEPEDLKNVLGDIVRVGNVKLPFLRVAHVSIVQIGEAYHSRSPHTSGDDALADFADDVVRVYGTQAPSLPPQNAVARERKQRTQRFRSRRFSAHRL